MVEPEVLFDKLASMTCQEIREYCFLQGVKGRQQVETHCVLAELFKRDTTAKHVSVGSNLCWAYDYNEVEEVDGDLQLAHARELTTAMRDFIINFDGDVYPELVLPVDSCV